MANEIIISAVQGLNVSLQLYNGNTLIGSSFAATEIDSTGEYLANMPSGVPYGKYLVIALVGDGIKIASGEIYWDGVSSEFNGVWTEHEKQAAIAWARKSSDNAEQVNLKLTQ